MTLAAAPPRILKSTSPPPSGQKRRLPMPVLASRMTALGTENAFKLGEDIARVMGRGMDVVKFNLGEPDFDSAEHINRVGMEQIEAGNSHYCDPAGILPFRQAIANHVEATRGLAVDPARIVVTPGAKPPISYSFQTYVDAGDEVIYPSPGFPIYESWVTFLGAVPKPSAPAGGARIRLHRRRPGGADQRQDQADHPQLAVEPDRRGAVGGADRRDRRAGDASAAGRTCGSTRTRSTSTSCSTVRATARSGRCPACRRTRCW